MLVMVNIGYRHVFLWGVPEKNSSLARDKLSTIHR